METIWSIWIVAFLLVVTGKDESMIILSGLPWWHRLLGGIAAAAFYSAHLC